MKPERHRFFIGDAIATLVAIRDAHDNGIKLTMDDWRKWDEDQFGLTLLDS